MTRHMRIDNAKAVKLRSTKEIFLFECCTKTVISLTACYVCIADLAVGTFSIVCFQTLILSYFTNFYVHIVTALLLYQVACDNCSLNEYDDNDYDVTQERVDDIDMKRDT